MAAVSKSSGELATGYAATAVKLIDRLITFQEEDKIKEEKK